MLELYGYWRSQAAYRVRIAMALKGLQWREHLVDLVKGEQFAGAVAEHNPHHAVPVLIDGPRVLPQSLAIMDYLNDLHPSPPLLPAEPYDRAKVRAFALVAVADSHPLVVPRVRKRVAEQFKASPADVTAWNNHWQTLASAAMEKVLAERAQQSSFCFGEQPGLADICLAAHVAGCQNSETPFEQFERLTQINACCQQLEAFSANHPWVIRDHGPRT
jgi:maleylacetoacetate isomerase